MAQHAVMQPTTAPRPRHYAERILARVNELLLAELKQVPPEYRGSTLDHVQDHIAKRHFRRLARRLSA